MVSSNEILLIIELIYYLPAFIVSLLIVRRHGITAQLGWRFLVLFCVFRIVGSATGIAASAQSQPSTSLITTSDIMLSFGLSSLILATIGLVWRVSDTMPEAHRPQTIFYGLINLAMLAALIVSIIGATDIFASSSSDRAEGHALIKAGTTIFLVVWLVLFLRTFQIALKIQHLLAPERRLVIAVAASAPFLTTRIVYSMISAWTNNSKYFNPYSGLNVAVIVHAVMAVAPELIVVAIYLFVGVPVEAKLDPKAKGGQRGGPPNYDSASVEEGNESQQQLPMVPRATGMPSSAARASSPQVAELPSTGGAKIAEVE